jgi:hypothetical protein
VLTFDEFGVQDRSPEERERIYALLRRKTPEERLAMVFERCEFTRELRRATAHLRPNEVKPE